MRYKFWTHHILFIFALALCSSSLQAQDLAAGKTVFRANCASCHAGDMKTKLTGPALGGAEERWEDYGGQEAIYAWIRNSQALVAEGNERAVSLLNEWDGTVMTAFLNLSDDDITNVLAYVDDIYVNGVPGPKVENGPDGATASKDNTWVYIGLSVVLALLALILARIISNLNDMVTTKETGVAPKSKGMWQILTGAGVLAFLAFLLTVFGGYYTVNNAISLGRQQGYQPVQPIKFSHKTHAGVQQIDCNYCHDGARRSKQSVIPAANTCMNCHKAIKVGSQDGTAEITKIYASIGYDPTTDKYIEDYDQMSNDDIAEIYKPWIAENGTGDGPDAEWEAIFASLTDEAVGDDKVAGPINWVRIHNLPDHVYFNHSQHVGAGKLECQTCHGAVEEMDVVEQYAPLSMGWCVNCHRQTEVQFAGNEYYKTYELYHQELEEGTRNKVTVEDIGGLECQKCHY